MSKKTHVNDPMVGTWKLNLSKSTYSPGPAPKSAINKFDPWEDGIKATMEMVDGQGNIIHSEATVKFDGRDYPIKGSPIADTVSVKRANEKQAAILWKKAGKITMAGKSVISGDGRTTTLTQTGTDPQGHAVNNTAVYDKQ